MTLVGNPTPIYPTTSEEGQRLISYMPPYYIDGGHHLTENFLEALCREIARVNEMAELVKSQRFAQNASGQFLSAWEELLGLPVEPKGDPPNVEALAGTDVGFEGILTGWTDATGWTLTGDAAQQNSGAKSGKLTYDGGGAVGTALSATLPTLEENTEYVVSRWLWLPTGYSGAAPYLDITGLSDIVVPGGSTPPGAFSVAAYRDQWQKVSFQFRTGTDVSGVAEIVVPTTLPVAGEFFYVDDAYTYDTSSFVLLPDATRRARVLAALRLLHDPAGSKWEEAITLFIGPSWEYEETGGNHVDVTLPMQSGTPEGLAAEAFIRRVTPAHIELSFYYSDYFRLGISQLDYGRLT